MLRAAQETHEMPKQVAGFFGFRRISVCDGGNSLWQLTKLFGRRNMYFVDCNQTT